MFDFEAFCARALSGKLVRWSDVVDSGFDRSGTGAVWERYHETMEARLVPYRRKFLVRTFKDWLRGLLTGERRYNIHYYFVFQLGWRKKVMFREEIAQL